MPRHSPHRSPRTDHGGQSGGQPHGVVPGCTVECRHRRQDELGTASRTADSRPRRSTTESASAITVCNDTPPRWASSTPRCSSGEKPSVSPGLRLQVEDDDHPGRRGGQRRRGAAGPAGAAARRCTRNRGPRRDHVGLGDRLEHRRGHRRVGRGDPDLPHPARGRRRSPPARGWCACAAGPRGRRAPRAPPGPAARRPSAAPGPARPAARRGRRGRARCRRRASRPARSGPGCRPGDRPARRCRRSGAAAARATSCVPLPVAGQGGQRHAQVARGSTGISRRIRPEEPPSSATVTTAVTSRVSRRQARQRRGQAVPAAERDRPAAGGLRRAALTTRGPDRGGGRPRRCPRR